MRIFLADPALINFKGHQFNYLACLCEPLRQLGHEVHVLGNRQISPEARVALDVVPAFTHGHESQMGQLFKRNYLPVIHRSFFGLRKTWTSDIPGHALVNWFINTVTKDMDELQARFAFTAADEIIVNTVTYHNIAAIAEWVLRQTKGARPSSIPRFTIILHFSLRPQATSGDALEKAYQQVFRFIEDNQLQNYFLLYTDSEILTREYAAITSMTIATLPIPHTYAPLEKENKNSVPCISYSGIAFLSHGFPFLPYVVSRLAQEAREGKVRFEFQAQLPSEEFLLTLTRERLRHLPVTLHEGTLSKDAYYGLMNKADIYLLPYMTDHYHSQTSGVFAEVMSFGCIPIVSRGTWMAYEAALYNTGVTCLPGDPESLYESLVYALDHIEELRASADLAAKKWRQFNSPSGFIEVLSRSIDGIGNIS